jgi:hypothetical protein
VDRLDLVGGQAPPVRRVRLPGLMAARGYR